ncbi:hypothetical protein F5B20DRAFT_571501 [Whalleya microplaca]|nr:hypothetical protein F5B20DRAFT_571501 [Whalleya microplaca]
MDVSNPRRILAVSLEDSTLHLTRVIKDLTGNQPDQNSPSLAGSSHILPIRTAYYTAEIPIWLDLISLPSEWAGSFLSAEAKEVLEVLGGVMVVFSLPVKSDSDEGKAARELIQNVGKVVKDGLGGWSWDGVGLCLGVGEIDDVDEWEDCCAEWGLEFVQVKSKAFQDRNEFGEKTGIPRALEALESNDWAQVSADDLGSEFGDFETELNLDKDNHNPNTGKEGKEGPDLDPESLDFGFDREDFAGLRRAIWKAGQDDEEDLTNGESSMRTDGKVESKEDEHLDDDEIQKLERMMVKLQAVRDTSAGLPDDQRKRAAAKAVAEVMREI